VSLLEMPGRFGDHTQRVVRANDRRDLPGFNRFLQNGHGFPPIRRVFPAACGQPSDDDRVERPGSLKPGRPSPAHKTRAESIENPRKTRPGTGGNPGHIRISLSVAHQLPWQRLYL
jgi:hypothetical protein